MPRLVAVVGGVTFSLAAPPTDLYAAVFVGLGALYLSIATAKSRLEASVRGLVWAAAAGVVGMRFVPEVVDNFTSLGRTGGLAALLLLSLFQGLAWAVGALVAHVGHHRLGLDARFAFSAGVVVAIAIPTVFAWSPAGLLSPWPVLLQLAEHVGERGVSFLVALVSALFGDAVLKASSRARGWWLSVCSGVALLACIVLHGAWRISKVAALHSKRPTIKIGVVQAAVPAKLRWEPSQRRQILAWLRRLTVQAERQGAELTLWPEAAYPYAIRHDESKAPRGYRSIVGGGVRGPILTGLITTRADDDGRHNAAVLVGRDRALQRPQAKLRLLWFGEAVPLGEYLPFLRRAFFRSGGLVPGDEVALQRFGDVPIGVLNCYEDILPAVALRITRARPKLLVNLTNDAWFGPTAEPELHLRLSVARAIESRLDLVRAVNLGVPAWVDAAGRVRRRGPDAEQGVMMVEARVATNDTSPTLYSKVGDVPLWLGLVVASLGGLLRTRRESPVRDATEPDPSEP